MNAEKLKQEILRGFIDLTEVTQTDPHECQVRLPFYDSAGDPFELSVYSDENRTTVDDAGSIAGLLFSLNQTEDGDPPFELLKSLASAHNLYVNYEDGLVQLQASDHNVYDAVAELAKVVITLHTAAAHIRRPRR